MTERGRNASLATLRAFGTALRDGRARRRMLRKRTLMIGLGIAALAATVAWPPRPLLVWNASASAPEGLYRVGAATVLESGDMVIARLPDLARRIAARRGYLPANVPLVKRVAAIGGDLICARGTTISVNGQPLVERRRFDGLGRPMPWWTGCVRLRGRSVFLIMTASPDSFDGRYFGPTRQEEIIGRARLIWAR